MKARSLQELAEQFGLELIGDGGITVDGVCTLLPGQPSRLSFLSNPKLRASLAETSAGAVIIGERDRAGLRGAGLVARDPYLAYARIARLFDPDRDFAAGVDARASVAAEAGSPKATRAAGNAPRPSVGMAVFQLPGSNAITTAGLASRGELIQFSSALGKKMRIALFGSPAALAASVWKTRAWRWWWSTALTSKMSRAAKPICRTASGWRSCTSSPVVCAAFWKRTRSICKYPLVQ